MRRAAPGEVVVSLPVREIVVLWALAWAAFVVATVGSGAWLGAWGGAP